MVSFFSSSPNFLEAARFVGVFERVFDGVFVLVLRREGLISILLMGSDSISTFWRGSVFIMCCSCC